jgi:hypothetical protein
MTALCEILNKAGIKLSALCSGHKQSQQEKRRPRPRCGDDTCFVKFETAN